MTKNEVQMILLRSIALHISTTDPEPGFSKKCSNYPFLNVIKKKKGHQKN